MPVAGFAMMRRLVFVRFGLERSDFGRLRANMRLEQGQTELVMEQLKLCVEAAGSSLSSVLKCNVYCTSVDKFAAVNAIYARYFRRNPPARIFVCVPSWPGHFDIEIDCIAAR